MSGAKRGPVFVFFYLEENARKQAVASLNSKIGGGQRAVLLASHPKSTAVVTLKLNDSLENYTHVFFGCINDESGNFACSLFLPMPIFKMNNKNFLCTYYNNIFAQASYVDDTTIRAIGNEYSGLRFYGVVV